MKQREIKFRAWDGEKMWEIDGNSKVVLEFNKISGWNIVPNKPNYQCKYLAGESSANKEFHLMQFTGLKDKNGVEIYENDILKYSQWKTKDGISPMGGNGFKSGKVYFLDGRFVVEGNEIWETLKYKHIEIIGNIHQNKDLLK